MERMGSEHPGEDAFERYALGAGSEEQSEAFEEHLLVCEPCRRHLSEVEAYCRGVKAAAGRIREQERASRVIGFPSRLVWALAAGLAVLGAVLTYRGIPLIAPVPAMQIVLEASRGPVSAAPAGRPLELRPDLGGLAAFDRYPLEVVDARNVPVWRGELRGADPRVVLPGRGPGKYFVRVYSPTRELLREYGLELKQ
jgi:hypothetical protein